MLSSGALGPKKITKEVVSSSETFPSITQHILKEIRNLNLDLLGKFHNLPGFEEYTGTGEPVGGGGKIYNSVITATQLRFAISMSRHALLYEIVKNPAITTTTHIAKELIENQILKGMKVLDLGSSADPIFARCLRQMGADVWTVDKEPITQISERITLPEPYRTLEVTQHIAINLNDPEAIQKILESTGGNFNLATEANLWTDGFCGGREISMKLLKPGGVYYDPPMDPELKGVFMFR